MSELICTELIEHCTELFLTKGEYSGIEIKDNECQILSPNADIEKIKVAKQNFINAVSPTKNIKVEVINVPVLIVIEVG